MPSTTICRGNIIANFLVGPTLTPVSVLANTTADQNFSVAGLLANDQINVNFIGAQTAGIGISFARCTTANILTINFGNITSGALTPAAGIYVIQVIRPENMPLPLTAV